MGKRNNSIIISVVLVAFLIGTITANPVVEAAGGWKAAFDDLINGNTAVDLNPASTIGGSSISTGAHPVPTLNVQTVIDTTRIATAGVSKFSSAICPSGTKLVGGGYQNLLFSGTTDAVVFQNSEVSPNHWSVGIFVTSGPDLVFRAVAHCASITT